MLKTSPDQNDRKQEWQKTDARVLGQILAAQNILFVLPDTTRTAEFFAQALVSVPGVTSCRVCLGDVSVQVGLESDVCRECEALRKEIGEPSVMPFGFKCKLAEQRDIRIIIITLETSKHTYGFFVFRTDATGVFESYRPFINNLSNYIALSLENRLQKNLLQRSEEKFRDIYSESPIGIEVYDSSGALLDANKACLDIFGIADIEDVKGFKLFEDPNVTDAVKKKLLEGETVRYEASFDFEKVKEYRLYRTTKSGISHLDVLITPLGRKEGVASVGYLVQTQDATARKRAEDELKKHQEHLEEIIKERTAELTAANKQLYQEINEHKRTEEKLVQQSRTLDSFFKYTITPLVILDRHFNFIRVNEAYAAACQRDVSEFPGHNHFEFYPTDARIIFEQVVETKVPFQTLARPFGFPDHPEWGETYWDWTLIPILSDTGEVEFLVFSLKDVTEGKRGEEKLRQSERMKTIMNRIANVFLTMPDEEVYGEVLRVVLDVMESRFGIFGFIANNGDIVIPSMTREVWSECQVPDKSIVFPPHTWGGSLWGRAIREKKAFYSNNPFHTPEGHIHIFNFLTVPVIFADKTIGLLSVANKDGGYTEEDKGLQESIANAIAPILNTRLQRDLQERERVRVEEALQKSEGRLRTLVQTIPDLIWLKDTEGVYLACNTMFERFFGAKESQIVGKTDYDFVDRKLADFFREHDRKAMAAGNPSSNEEWITFADDGHRALLDTTKTPTFDAEGKLIGVLGISRDITERKQTEDELRFRNLLLSTQQEVSIDGILVVDEHGKMISSNQRFVEMWEISSNPHARVGHNEG